MARVAFALPVVALGARWEAHPQSSISRPCLEMVGLQDVCWPGCLQPKASVIDAQQLRRATSCQRTVTHRDSHLGAED